jgi:hypothetical protein
MPKKISTDETTLKGKALREGFDKAQDEIIDLRASLAERDRAASTLKAELRKAIDGRSVMNGIGGWSRVL